MKIYSINEITIFAKHENLHSADQPLNIMNKTHKHNVSLATLAAHSVIDGHWTHVHRTGNK